MKKEFYNSCPTLKNHSFPKPNKTSRLLFLAHSILASLTISLSTNSTSAIPSSIASDYELIWEDEFTGTQLNTADWFINEGAKRDAINVTDTITVSNGYLSIRTYTQDNQAGTANDVHHTGFISTSDRLMFPFGYFEARIRFDNAATGMWTAFWQMPRATPPADPEAGVEIDIFEYRAHKANQDISDNMHYALHWNGYGANHQKAGTDVTPLGNGTSMQDGQFHTYGVLRTPTKYEFYFDNVLVATLDPSTNIDPANNDDLGGVSHAYSTLLLTTEVENNYWWCGNLPDAGYGSKGNASNPLTTVDWVRAYSHKPGVSGQSAYGGNSVPGSLQAENFDQGGKGVSYYDKDGSGYNGTEYGSDTAYRSGVTVDIEQSTTAANNRYVSHMKSNEWLEYTLNAAYTGIYSIEAVVANGNTSKDGKMEAYVDGQALGSMLIEDTGGIDTWVTQSWPGITQLQSGASNPAVLATIMTSNNDFSFDSIKLNYLGNAWDFREAEDANLSGNLTLFTSYINGFGNTVDSATFSNVDGFDGGDTLLTLRYARYSTSSQSPAIRVKLNGSYVQDGNGSDLLLTLPTGSSWNVHQNTSVTIPNMLAGTNNTVVLESLGTVNQKIRLDYVVFSKSVVTGGQQVALESEGNEIGSAVTGSHSNASGGSYSKGFSNWQSGVHWQNIQSSSSGTGTLTIHYARPTSSVLKTLEVNGVESVITFSQVTSSWTDFTGVLTVPIYLVTGTNDIKIWREGTNGDSGELRIDYIVVTLPTSASLNISLEAESNEIGSASTGNSSNASGGSYSKGFSNWQSGVHWQNVQSPSAQAATMTIHYARPTSSVLKTLEVNGVESVITFSQITSSWTDFTGVLTVPIYLVTGTNDIKIWREGSNGDSGELRIDYIEITSN